MSIYLTFMNICSAKVWEICTNIFISPLRPKDDKIEYGVLIYSESTLSLQNLICSSTVHKYLSSTRDRNDNSDVSRHASNRPDRLEVQINISPEAMSLPKLLKIAHFSLNGDDRRGCRKLAGLCWRGGSLAFFSPSPSLLTSPAAAAGEPKALSVGIRRLLE